MALQVWLPLNGDLRNQGLANVTVTNSGATVDNAGKIGKCYSFNSNAIYGSITGLSDYTNCSACCWAYLTNSNGAQYFFHFGGQTAWQCKIAAHYQGAVYLVINGSEYNTGVTLTLNTWHHIAVTVNGTTVKLYKNGSEVASTSITSTFSSSNNYAIGARTNSSTGTSFVYQITSNGKLNDIRLYDHCLSPKEVKEISKGLVLHYKLDDPYVEATTNYGRMLDSVSLNSACVNDWSIEKIDRDTVKVTALKDNPAYAQWGDITNTISGTRTITAGNPCTLSCEIVDYKGSLGRIFPASGGFGAITGYQTLMGRVARTITYTANWTHNFIIRSSDQANIKAGDYLVIRNTQIEEKDHATPYTPSSRTSSIVYDCSGYGYNGTITGSLTSEVPSPRYTYDTKFGGHNCYFLAKNPFYNNVQPLTVAFWFKPNSSNASYNTIVSNTNPHGGFWLSANTEGAGCWSYNNGLYVHGASGTLSNNQWYHMVWQYKGNNQYQWYLNGSTITTTTSGTLKAPVFTEYLSVGGCQCSDSSTSSSRYDQYGSISDLRFYAAVLSADDIKDLYQTSASIHNTGAIEAFEFEETSRNNCLFDYTNTSSISTTGWGRSVSYNNDGYLVLTANNGWATFGWNTSSYSGKTICVDFDYRFTNLDNINGSWLSVAPSMGYYSSVRDLDISELNIWKHCRTELTANNYFMIMLRGVDETGLSVVMNVKNLSIILKDSVTSTTSINKNGIIESSILKEDTCDTTISMEGIRGKQLIEI